VVAGEALQQGGWKADLASSNLRRFVTVLSVCALSVVVVRLVLVQSFVIPSGSMEPTLQVGDRVLVSRAATWLGGIHRGDVLVFDGTGVFDPASAPPASRLARAGQTLAAALGVPVGEKDFVKRVIGLPGDRVVCCDPQGRITVDGRAVDEPYLQPGDRPSDQRFDVVVPPGRLWMMGDHRSSSADSRAHLADPGGGTVPMSRVLGRVVAVSWPPSHLAVVHGSRSEESQP
jgi:signal peptidase I